MSPARDLIAQLATAPGEAALAVIRLSGPGAHALLGRLFRSAGGGALEPRRATLGDLIDPASGATLDRVLVTLFAEGFSYTGEEMAEVSCHGGPWLARRILATLCAHGARPAEPGEFTKRAYLGGRLDLAQAEAVCALIRARSESAARASLRQLEGALARRLETPRTLLLALAADLEASLDYPDDDTGSLGAAEVAGCAAPVLEDLYGLLAEAPAARLAREGIAVALVGRPNVGKSSLLNRLLGHERAIVTPDAGTTRDTLDAWTEIAGVAVRLTDTAGLRGEGRDEAERLGMERAGRALAGADIAIAVFDGSTELTDDDRLLLDRLSAARVAWIACRNKSDLPERLRHESLASRGCARAVRACALVEGGDAELREALAGLIRAGGLDPAEALLATERQVHAVREAVEALDRVVLGGAAGTPVDLLASDLTEALEALDRVTGRATTEDVLEAVFSRFCLGK